MSSAMPSPCKMSGKNQPNNILLRIADVKKEIINTKTVLSLCYKWSIWLQRYMLNKSTKHQIWHMILCVTDKLGCWYHVWDSSGFYSYTYSRLEMVTCPFCYTFIIYHSSLKGKSTVFWCRSFCLDTLRYYSGQLCDVYHSLSGHFCCTFYKNPLYKNLSLTWPTLFEFVIEHDTLNLLKNRIHWIC